MRLFDRPDGKRLTKLSHYSRIIPFVMPKRVNATVHYSETINIDEALKVLKEMNDEHGMNAGIMDLIMAAFVRTLSQKPKLNRFVFGKKIYARNKITSSVAIKKEMNENAETTELKVDYEPTDTLLEVSKKIRTGIEENKGLDTSNNQDGFTKMLNVMPDFLISFVIFLVKAMDRMRILPKSILELSPFHASFFITNLGSLRINSVYHHLYELGTVSWFIGMGRKIKKFEVDADGNKVTKRYIELKCVFDERIVDGFYSAKAIRLVMKLIANPRLLLEPPKQVVVDDEI
jgi:pyruvate/2-oxoglutarate dehydrogenase complex dihydrolipoamide acyltransferase (E2) component